MLTIVLIFIASFLFIGVLNKTKALAGGRKGPGLTQHIKDILRLVNKQTVYSTTTSIIFSIAPSIYFSSILMALCFIPFGSYQPLLSFKGDFVFFAYMLAFGKFFMIIAAFDTGSRSPFEGMGANKEVLYSMLVEPAFFLLMASFAMFTDHSSFYDIYNHIHFTDNFSWILGVMASFILVQISMVENGRLPVGDPKTPLEPTMIHEVMILDNSGFDLAMILYGTSLKFVMYGTFICNFFLDSTMSLATEISVFFLVQFIWAITAGLLESFRARERMKKNPPFIFSLMAISIVIFFGILIWQQKFN
jgi:formate hydrogenlyase subunit 4